MAKEKKNVRIVNGEDLRVLMEKYENVSIRRIALTAEVNYGALLKASKAPIPGEVYDAEAVNYDAIATELAKRNINFLEDAGVIDWEALNVETKKAAVEKNLDDFNIGDNVYIRKHPTTPYTVVYKTKTHIVIQLEGSTEPQCWAHNTLLLNGPSKTPRNTGKVAASEDAEVNEVSEVEADTDEV